MFAKHLLPLSTCQRRRLPLVVTVAGKVTLLRGPVSFRRRPAKQVPWREPGDRFSPSPLAPCSQVPAMPFSNSHNLLKKNYSAEDEYPDLSAHNNHMAKVLTLDLYCKLRGKQTSSGFSVDDVIQTGVDNPGKRKRTPWRSVLPLWFNEEVLL